MPNPPSSDTKPNLVSHALREHQLALSAYVRARVPSSEVEDLLQSAALKAFERAESLEDPARVLPWLYRIHHNLIIDRVRANKSRRRMLDRVEQQEAHTADQSEFVASNETCACSVHLAHTLPSNYADILDLVDLGDASITQAASQLGISTNNAMVRLHRARKALKKTLMDHCGVSDFRQCNNCRCALEGCCPV